jgi:LPS export ABC transporter protein LptC
MDTFTMTGYSPEGVKEWDLEGRGAIAEGAIVTIRQPRAIGYDPGRTSHLTASLAHVNQNTRHIRLEHEVTVHTSDGVWFMTPQMYWLSSQDEMRTEESARIETDHMLIRGRGAVAHAQLKTAILERDIELVMNPSEAEMPGEPVSHVTITCEGPLEFEYEKGIATFHQNVHVKDNQGDLYTDKLIAYVNQATHTIKYADAIGQVRIVQGAHTAHGERAVYEPALAKVTLLGSPYLVLYPDEQTPSPTVSTAEQPQETPHDVPQQVAATVP